MQIEEQNLRFDIRNQLHGLSKVRSFADQFMRGSPVISFRIACRMRSVSSASRTFIGIYPPLTLIYDGVLPKVLAHFKRVRCPTHPQLYRKSPMDARV